MTLGNFLIDSHISWSYRQDQRRKISFRAYPPRLTLPYARTSSLQMTVTLTVKEGKKYSNHWILRKLKGKTRQHWLPASLGGGSGGVGVLNKVLHGKVPPQNIARHNLMTAAGSDFKKKWRAPGHYPYREVKIPCCWLTQVIRSDCDQMLLELVL